MTIVQRVTGPAVIKPLAIALGVSLVANVILFGLWRINRAESESAETKLEAATDANAGNMATINAQRDALDACVGLDQFVARLAEKASADYEAAKALREQAAADRRAARSKVYANNPNCGAWAAGPVCRAVSDGL